MEVSSEDGILSLESLYCLFSEYFYVVMRPWLQVLLLWSLRLQHLQGYLICISNLQIVESHDQSRFLAMPIYETPVEKLRPRIRDEQRIEPGSQESLTETLNEHEQTFLLISLSCLMKDRPMCCLRKFRIPSVLL